MIDRGLFLCAMRWNRHHFENKETIVTILCPDRYLKQGAVALNRARRILESYISLDPEFQRAEHPYDPPENAPRLVRKMCQDAAKAGVGPMATVAGAFACQSLTALLEAGAEEAVVDNGGDIAMMVREPVRVGIFAGNASIDGLAFDVLPRNRPLGICTSSGTVGPSLSYGCADAAVVVSSNVLLADAAATALGNRVKGKDDLETCFDFLKDIAEVEGAMVILNNQVALWGRLPRLIRTTLDTNLITKGGS